MRNRATLKAGKDLQGSKKGKEIKYLQGNWLAVVWSRVVGFPFLLI
jgi:hypothetical protein